MLARRFLILPKRSRHSWGGERATPSAGSTGADLSHRSPYSPSNDGILVKEIAVSPGSAAIQRGGRCTNQPASLPASLWEKETAKTTCVRINSKYVSHARTLAP